GTALSVDLNLILPVLIRRSTVLLISDFLDDGYVKPLRIVARRHDTIAVHLIDPRERELPPVGLLDLVDAETGETVVVYTSNRRTRRHFAMHAGARHAHTAELVKHIQMDYVPIQTDSGYVEPLIQLLDRKSTR